MIGPMTEQQAHNAEWRARLKASGYFAKDGEVPCPKVIAISCGAAMCERPAGHDGDCETVCFDWDLT